MKLAYQLCPRCHARAFYVTDGLGHCNRCQHRARTEPTAAMEAHAALQELLQIWPRDDAWMGKWMAAHAAWCRSLI